MRTESLIRLRILAAKVLAQVSNSDSTIDEAFTEVLYRGSGKMRAEFDRSWVFEIVSGVLRYRGRVDFILDTYALKKKPTGAVRRLLLTAVYQLLVQDTPSALVVSEAVQAIRESEGDFPAKFANAVLRKIADARDRWKQWSVTAESSPSERLAFSGLPKWLFEKLEKQIGSLKLMEFSQAALNRPEVWTHPRGFVQDRSNQLLLARFIPILKQFENWQNTPVLDLCAAPGGKSMALADAGFNVVATDRSEARLQLVLENRNQFKFSESQLSIQSFETIWNSSKKWSMIWADVPCSSVGIIGRHPEIKWNRDEKTVVRNVESQKQIRKWVRDHLEPGGIFVYSTCSVLTEENPTEIEGFEALDSHQFWPQDPEAGDGIYGWIGKN